MIAGQVNMITCQKRSSQVYCSDSPGAVAIDGLAAVRIQHPSSIMGMGESYSDTGTFGHLGSLASHCSEPVAGLEQ